VSSLFYIREWGVALEEKRAWIVAVVVACTYTVYLVILLSRPGPLAEAPYVASLLWTAGAAGAAAIGLGLAAGLTMPKESRKKDVRDREIEWYGDYIGQSFVAIAGVAALIMALAEADHFWIANTIYLCFALSSVLGAVAKIFAYRRGFQPW
jgi:hypothetical protein